MLQFELYPINKAPELVKKFIHQNLFQRNQNHNDQDTAQGIDYKLEEYNKLFKQFEISTSPSIEEWTRVASIAPKLKKLMENQAKDYNFEYGLYSEPGAPNYNKRIESCLKLFQDEETLSSEKVQPLQNLDGKKLQETETLNFDKEFRRRQNEYMDFVTEENSFIKAPLNFKATTFLYESRH